jgi:hypothetical protein
VGSNPTRSAQRVIKIATLCFKTLHAIIKIMKSIASVWNRLAYFTANFTNNRPLCFLSTVGGIRDTLVGIGFIFGLEQIRQTRLFQNYDALFPGYSGLLMGIAFIAIGLVVAVTATLDKTHITRRGLKIQAYAWLFSTLMYSFNGDFILAAIFGIFFSLPAGYLAFYYKYSRRNSN